jgi:hypothetical protein
MGRGIILRVLEGTVLSSELSRALDTLLPDHKIEYFPAIPDNRRSIKRRIHSLHKAFLFILDAYPLNPRFTWLTKETLINDAERYKTACDLSSSSLDDLRVEMAKYIARLVSVLSIAWPWAPKKEIKEAIGCLNEAEQYVLMKEGRFSIATLTPITLANKVEYVVQYDESLPPYSEQWLAELQLIKTQGFPKTKSGMDQGFGSVILEQGVKIPQWYWALSLHQKHFLEHVLKATDKIQDVVSFLSSRHRTLPAPANFLEHSLFKVNPSGEINRLYDARGRSSHIASRDMLDASEIVQKQHSDANLAMIMGRASEGQLFLLQTLISPIHAADFVPAIITDHLPELPPDLELYKRARDTVARSKNTKDILQHNHPLNIAKYFYYTQTHDKDSLRLLAVAKQHVVQFPALQLLITDYEHTLNSPVGSATVLDYDGRELFLISLEQLIILTLKGYSYGSCVSGKDRKAIELIHTDAMILYKEYYGCWPQYGAPKEREDRINFVNIVTTLYLSRHQHELAGQNAPGSEGIKTPDKYWPKDISEAINARSNNPHGLEFDDRLATDNEVKKIGITPYLLRPNELRAQLTAQQLGEKKCNQLYDVLGLLLHTAKKLFGKKVLYSRTVLFKEHIKLPTAIDEIHKIMLNKDAGKTNVERLAVIFMKVLDRPLQDHTRTDATQEFYDGIRNLCHPTSNASSFVTLAEGIEKDWRRLFEGSKEENSERVLEKFQHN